MLLFWSLRMYSELPHSHIQMHLHCLHTHIQVCLGTTLCTVCVSFGLHSPAQCSDQEVKCPELAQPPTVYNPAPIAITLVLLVLESIGAHGFIGFFASILLVLGFIKLSCGGVICCRKTKAQEHAERLIQKGVPPKSEHCCLCSHCPIQSL